MSNWHCPFIYHVHIESRCKIIKGYFIPRRNFALNTSWSVGTQKNYIDGSRIWVFFFLVEFETNEYYVGVWPQRKNCFFTLEYCLKYLTLLFCHLHTHTTPPCLPMSESWIYLAAEKICTKMRPFMHSTNFAPKSNISWRHRRHLRTNVAVTFL